LTRNAINGFTLFNDIRIANPGNGYTLIASSGSLTPATSAAFNIINPFVVTNTNDSGAGSLRQAILNANATAGTQTISFNITGTAPFTIVPTTPLPVITDPMNIDGRSQPGFSGAPIVEISGANLASVQNVKGLHFSVGNSSLKGLSITRFENTAGFLDSGVVLRQNDCIVQGNYIGITPAGTLAGNGTGITITGSSNVIGGSISSERNVISGNTGAGVSSLGLSNQIKGNYIGTDVGGTNAIGK